MIQFSVFDKDILTADDFGGEAFFPLSAVPGIYQRNLERCILTLYIVIMFNRIQILTISRSFKW